MSSEGRWPSKVGVSVCGQSLGGCGWGLAVGLLALLFSAGCTLLRLSPPPGDHDYIYNLDESEGVCDLFDVPVLNL